MAGENETRKIRFIGPPSEKPFDVARFSGTEGLSRMFEYEVQLLSLDLDVKFANVIGKPVAIVIDADAHGPERIVHGYVSRFSMVDRMVNHMKYAATIVPYVWFLNRTADCKIMPPNLTVPEIVRKVLSDQHFDEVEDGGLEPGAYKKRPYCVQYRETDFNFISRLLEEEGIYYYFEHRREDGVLKHVMVLADSSAEPPQGKGCEALHMSQQRDDSTNAIADWTVMNHVHSDEAFLTDFDFELRKVQAASGQAVYADLSNETTETRFSPPIPGNVYDYPGGFQTTHEDADRKRLARVRAEQTAVRRTVHRGLTTAHGLYPGVQFTVSGHDREDQNGSYLVISSSHEGWEALPEIGGEGTRDGEPYTVAFEAIDVKRPFRPPRTTVKPVIAGVQTALVVGNDKKEAFTDEYGRVRVKFHWDSSKEQGEKASCLIRVAQIWAGNRWGAMFMPRVGHEVVVEFLEGDPDRPLITGRVYNGLAKPKYDPQKHASVSTIKSMTNQDGSGFNELRFEDKKGSEQVFLNAQRQMDVRVGANLYETIGGNREEKIGSEGTGDLNVWVNNDVNTHVKGSQYELIDQKLNQHVKQEVVEVFEDNHTIAVSNRQTLNAKEIAIEAKSALSLKADTVVAQGAQALSLKAGQIKVEGTMTLSLKVGGTFLVLTPSGAFLNGTLVNINSGGPSQPADPPLTIQDPSIETPTDAEEATSALPGEQVAAGGAGPGRGSGAGAPKPGRKVKKVPAHRAPDPPPPPPAGGDVGPVDPDKKFIDIKWVEKETYCGGPATLTGTTKGYGDDASESAEIRNTEDGSTVASAPINIRGNAFKQAVDVKDWLPRKSGASFEEDRDEDAYAAGQKTPDALKMKFIPNLEKADCSLKSRTGVEARFAMLAANYVCQVIGAITYVEGEMGELIQLGASVPAATGGKVGINFGAAKADVISGTDWRFAKVDPAAPSGRVFWDGAAWKPVPITWSDAPLGTKLLGIGLYRDGNVSRGEYNLTWPDPIPDWTDAERAKAKGITSGWATNCTTAWSKIFDLRRDGCASSDQHCCRYSVEIVVTFTSVAKKTKSAIVIGINNARSNSDSWSLGDTRPGLAPHEFGHHLGCPDEYAGAGSVDKTVNSDGATAGIDPGSMMGSVPETGMAPVKARSFDIIKQHLANMIKAQKGKAFTFTAAPHI